MSTWQAFATISVAWTLWNLWRCLFNIYFHPLSRFPGPRLAATTLWWQTYYELYKGISKVDTVKKLHAEYGDIVRIGPDELHFSRPSAYHEIYNSRNRWDKEASFYKTFDQNTSSFGSVTYRESKERKDILNPMFSRSAIIRMQGLVQAKVDELCAALEAQYTAGKSSDILFGFRCFTMDTITTFCFAKSMNTINEPDFKAPLLEAMEVSMPLFVPMKHLTTIRWILTSLPPSILLKLASSQAAGLAVTTKILLDQVKEVSSNPKRLEDAPHPIIYHALLDPEAHKGRPLPTQRSLFDEAQTLLAAGSDTVGTTLMIGIYHICQLPEVVAKIEKELLAAWPNIGKKPRYENLEKLPYLTAIVKESLRITPGVISGLPRIVPPAGVTISDAFIPGGTVVSESALFVHEAESIFTNAKEFKPDRWLQPDSKSLESWLVTFSKGPRSCLGINLAYCELYIAFANLFRRFEIRLDETKPADLTWKECFLPFYGEKHPHAFFKPRSS